MSWSAVKLLHVTSMFFRMTQALLAEATGSTRNTNSPTGCNKTISMQQLRLQPVMKVKLIPSINGHTV